MSQARSQIVRIGAPTDIGAVIAAPRWAGSLACRRFGKGMRERVLTSPTRQSEWPGQSVAAAGRRLSPSGRSGRVNRSVMHAMSAALEKNQLRFCLAAIIASAYGSITAVANYSAQRKKLRVICSMPRRFQNHEVTPWESAWHAGVCCAVWGRNLDPSVVSVRRERRRHSPLVSARSTRARKNGQGYGLIFTIWLYRRNRIKRAMEGALEDIATTPTHVSFDVDFWIRRSPTGLARPYRAARTIARRNWSWN